LEELYWRQIFDKTYSGEIHSWAYRWTYSCWRHDLLTATPVRNLVTNIGTGAAASNTRDPEQGKHGLEACTLTFPLVHPLHIARDPIADDQAQQRAFGRAKDSSLQGRFGRFLLKIERKFLRFLDCLSRKCHHGLNHLK
jgi:hypothetical protein